jgi:hypothetical protein
MTTDAKCLASKAHESPLLQMRERVIVATHFFLGSIVLVYVVVLVSPQKMMTVETSWIKAFQSTELRDSLRLELRPALEENDSVQKVKTEVNTSHLITLSPDSSELA